MGAVSVLVAGPTITTGGAAKVRVKGTHCQPSALAWVTVTTPVSNCAGMGNGGAGGPCAKTAGVMTLNPTTNETKATSDVPSRFDKHLRRGAGWRFIDGH